MVFLVAGKFLLLSTPLHDTTPNNYRRTVPRIHLNAPTRSYVVRLVCFLAFFSMRLLFLVGFFITTREFCYIVRDWLGSASPPEVVAALDDIASWFRVPRQYLGLGGGPLEHGTVVGPVTFHLAGEEQRSSGFSKGLPCQLLSCVRASLVRPRGVCAAEHVECTG